MAGRLLGQSARNAGAVYVLVLVIVIFAIWIPSTFLRYSTFATILNQNAVIGIVALSLIVPLAAGVFDLSVGYTVSAVSVLVAWCLGNTGMSPAEVILVGIGLGAAIGVGNAVVVVIFQIDSFIATLATGSLLQALAIMISGDNQLSQGVNASFTQIARINFHNITLPVFYLLGIGLVLWFILEHRPVGRQAYAVGYGMEAARLTGVRIQRLRFTSLVVSGTLSGLGGIVVTATVGGGDPTIGPPYLIPAFAAAFLGATQFKQGRFNAWGTILAILLLGTAYEGLALAGVPIWAPYVVTGVVLIGAMSTGRLALKAKK
jgi:ribose transport system permease protein